MAEQVGLDKLREDARLVLRYWRVEEGWSPADLEEARDMLRLAVENGGEDVADAALFYASKVSVVRAKGFGQELPLHPQPSLVLAASPEQRALL